ncbi:hypothetical protein SAMN04488061_3334 [Filomicrobium insigne]|uniref:Uncharacterized protein n=1 Tax=Filomicrobium insigne TaxID=418854 RepID=A0A1H0TQU4_9HYPH|nr:hypothetical protein SAMN04488061_3334 [Filomicrobium insigne]
MLPSLRLSDGIARILKIAKFQTFLYRCPWVSTLAAAPPSRSWLPIRSPPFKVNLRKNLRNVSDNVRLLLWA